MQWHDKLDVKFETAYIKIINIRRALNFMGQLSIPGYQESTNVPLSNVLIHYTFNQYEIDSSTVSRG